MALLLRKVNAGQFEIPWDIFRRDVAAKQKDLFDAFVALTSQDEIFQLLSNARISTPHRYRNGKVVNYTLQTRVWPFANLLISIVEDFLQHPSFGLEVLLSTRFRHDTLRREIVRAVAEVSEHHITGVSNNIQRRIIEQLVILFPNEIDNWLDRRLHSNRPERPDALFDLTLSQEDLNELVAKFSSVEKFNEIIDHVIDWLRQRLDIQLEKACEIFQIEMGLLLGDSIKKQRDEIQDQNIYRTDDVRRVTTALETAISRRVEELTNWFSSSTGDDRLPLSFGEVKQAADGLFETEIARKTFGSVIAPCENVNRQIPSDKVRLCFDLISEVFSNACKHNGETFVRLRIWPFSSGGLTGFIFSNLTTPAAAEVIRIEEIIRIEGRRYTSQTDAIFREGNSGLPKIAALVATLIGQDTELVAYRRHRSFHLAVPIWKENE